MARGSFFITAESRRPCFHALEGVGQELPAGGPSAKDKPKGEKGESYWTERFAAIRYKMAIPKTESDILQRDLNVLLLQLRTKSCRDFARTYNAKREATNTEKQLKTYNRKSKGCDRHYPTWKMSSAERAAPPAGARE